MLTVVYYYVLYLKGDVADEIHARAFETKEEAETFKAKADEKFKDRLIKSKVMKRDLCKYVGRDLL